MWFWGEVASWTCTWNIQSLIECMFHTIIELNHTIQYFYVFQIEVVFLNVFNIWQIKSWKRALCHGFIIFLFLRQRRINDYLRWWGSSDDPQIKSKMLSPLGQDNSIFHFAKGFYTCFKYQSDVTSLVLWVSSYTKILSESL